MTSLRITADVEVLDTAALVALAGPGNEHLKIVARALSIDCGVRGNTIRLAGQADAVAVAERFLAEAADDAEIKARREQREQEKGEDKP